MYIKNLPLKKNVSFWLASMFWIISIMIIVGGLTRLTDSGLSITQWQLFSGFFPPFSDSDWNKYFTDKVDNIEWNVSSNEQIELLNTVKNIFVGEDINTLIKDAFFSDNIRVKSSAIRAMGISSNPIWLSLILSDLDDVYPSITVSSIEAVGMLGDGDYANWLMKYLSDEDVDIQIAAVKSLAIIGNEVARGAILQFVDELQESEEDLDDDLLAAINVAIQAMDFDEAPLDMQVDYKDYLQ